MKQRRLVEADLIKMMLDHGGDLSYVSLYKRQVLALCKKDHKRYLKGILKIKKKLDRHMIPDLANVVLEYTTPEHMKRAIISSKRKKKSFVSFL